MKTLGAIVVEGASLRQKPIEGADRRLMRRIFASIFAASACWLLFAGCSTTVDRRIDYSTARYTASDEAVAKAKADLATNLVGEATALTNLFSSPMVCGPGLWDILKHSRHFSKPPVAKAIVRIPLAKGKVQELPMGLFQSEDEVASFRKALADLINSQGTLTIREFTKDEFRMFWAIMSFREFPDPLLVAEGRDLAFFCSFEKEGKVFFVDEVKRMHIEK